MPQLVAHHVADHACVKVDDILPITPSNAVADPSDSKFGKCLTSRDLATVRSAAATVGAKMDAALSHRSAFGQKSDHARWLPLNEFTDLEESQVPKAEAYYAG